MKKGKHILFTPGIYYLDKAIHIKQPNTILMGIGLTTLIPQKGNKAIHISDVEGVTVSSLLIDASSVPSKNIMQAGNKKKQDLRQTLHFFSTYFSELAVLTKVLHPIVY